MSKTIARVEALGKTKFLAIRKVDENGNVDEEKQVVGFGLVKAKAILEHLEEIKKFVEEEGK